MRLGGFGLRVRLDLRKLLSTAFLIGLAQSAGAQSPPDTDATISAIAGNPGAVNIVAGTGELGRLLGLDPETGLRLGGVLVSNGNYLISGGNTPGTTSFNNLLVTDLDADLDKLAHIPGASFGAAMLRFDGQPTNQQAGVVTGYNGLTGAPPLDRTELYELWWRQSLFSDQLVVRIGKTVPTYDFGNVVRPVPVQDLSLRIPAVSGLLYTPVFVNPTMLGALPGYYNSAYGVTATIAPTERFYVSLGGYDGNVARREQTGLRPRADLQRLSVPDRRGRHRLAARARQSARRLRHRRLGPDRDADPVDAASHRHAERDPRRLYFRIPAAVARRGGWRCARRIGLRAIGRQRLADHACDPVCRARRDRV